MPAKASIRLVHSGFSPEIKLEYNVLRKSVLILRSINHTLRQQIIQMLLEKEKLTVTEIFIKMRLEQSVASQHLAILKRSGVVTSEREGKNIYYMLKKDRLREIGNMIIELSHA
ncbi:MAG: helix-turn-helix transcriptional regulator [Fimbriimonadaceae bacterium]|nr:helix-turn-helix transcriptional regulator [Chitinophagales bacterium]